ncbi:hypothetical protein KBC97_01170 [Candidatus Gracilibacteria bacterium]|nr:hypothetical protein [Candidatus Gracilibacteria bacterium]
MAREIQKSDIEKIANPVMALEMKKDILRKIFLINRDYAAISVCRDIVTKNIKDCEEDIKVQLGFYRQVLVKMEVFYPEDKDLPMIKKLVDDIELDIYRNSEGQSLRLDQSLGEILIEKEFDLKESGISKIDLNKGLKKFPNLSKELQRLRDLGVEPDYLVPAENPNAPIVVLFLEEHFVGKKESSKEAIKSDQYIERSLMKIIVEGVVKDIYVESESEEYKIIYDKEEIDEYSDAVKRISAKFGSKVNIYGTEYLDISRVLLEKELENFAKKLGLKDPLKIGKLFENSVEGGAAFFSRAALENIFIAMNVRDAINRSKSPISIQIIGAGHEINENEIVRKKNLPHPLPISNLLAYNGLNVFVVDATKK